MLVFIDTEFTDFVQIDLISIALVTEDGCEFYTKRTDYRVGDCNDFVRAAVLPMLGRVPGASCDRTELTRRLRAWFDALLEPATLVFDYFSDWELLADALLGDEYGPPPRNIGDKLHLGQDVIRNAVFQIALNRTFTRDWPPHHALADARALHAGYRAYWIAKGEKVWGQDAKLTVLTLDGASLVARLSDGREFRSQNTKALAAHLLDAGIRAEDVRALDWPVGELIPTRKQIVVLMGWMRREPAPC